PPTSHTSPQQPGRHSPWNSAPRFLRLAAAESQVSPPERVRSKPAVTTTTKKHSPAHRRQPSRVHPAVTRLAFIKPTGVRAIPPDDRRERSCAIAAALPLVVLSFMLFRASLRSTCAFSGPFSGEFFHGRVPCRLGPPAPLPI